MRHQLLGPSAALLIAVLPSLAALTAETGMSAQPGALLGWLGSGLLSVSLLLMVREPAVAAWYGGLDRMYRWHHAFGTLGYVALLGHAVAVAAPILRGEPALAWHVFVPWGQGWAGLLGWLALLGLMAGLATTFVIRLPYSVWRLLHAMLAIAVLLGIGHVVAIKGLSPGAGFLAVAVAIAIVWRFLRADHGMGAWPYEVRAVSHPAPDTAEVTLRPLAGALATAPGQYVMGAFFDGPHYRGCGEYHPFTVSGVGEGGALIITIKALGDCTRSIQALEPGVAARIQGPFGTFLGQRAPAPEVWIAGGIGITPFMAALRGDAVRRPTLFIYAHRDAADAAYLDEIAILAGRQPLLDYRPLVLQEDVAPIHALLDSIPDLSARHAYLCGPLPLVAAVERQLRERGMPASSIHTESYDLR